MSGALTNWLAGDVCPACGAEARWNPDQGVNCSSCGYADRSTEGDNRG